MRSATKITLVASGLAISVLLPGPIAYAGPAYTTTIGVGDVSSCRIDATFRWTQVPQGAVYFGVYYSQDGVAMGGQEGLVANLAPGATSFLSDMYGTRDGVRHRWTATGYFSAGAVHTDIVAKKTSKPLQLTCAA